MRSCQHLKEYNIIKNFICNSSFKLDLLASFFKSIYHFYFLKINFLFNYIDYLIKHKEEVSNKEIDNLNNIETCILYLYSLCFKNMKIYASKL